MSQTFTALDPDVLPDLTDIQVLTGLIEMGGGPGLDSFELAHDLLHQCGSLEQTLALPTPQLFSFPGLGEDAASFLLLMSELIKRHAQPQPQHLLQIQDEGHLRRLLRPHFDDVTEERLYILCVDEDWHLLTSGLIAQGDKASVTVGLRRLLDLVMSHPTRGVVLAHNHPCGAAIFSEGDFDSSQELADYLALLEVALLDHYLIADRQMVSLRRQLEAAGQPIAPFTSMANGKPQGDLP